MHQGEVRRLRSIFAKAALRQKNKPFLACLVRPLHRTKVTKPPQEKKRLLSSKTAIDFKVPYKQLPLLRRREFKKPEDMRLDSNCSWSEFGWAALTQSPNPTIWSGAFAAKRLSIHLRPTSEAAGLVEWDGDLPAGCGGKWRHRHVLEPVSAMFEGGGLRSAG